LKGNPTGNHSHFVDRPNPIGDLDELKAQMDDKSEHTILDLDDVTLVDAAVIRFLSSSEREGVTPVHCPPYVREWIGRERVEGETQSDED